MEIVLQNRTEKRVDERKISEVVSAVVSEELDAPPKGILNIVLTDDEDIVHVNKTYRGKSYPTDILTFEYGLEEDVLGDMMISLETIERQAPEFDNSFEEELLYIVIHGVLHLLGFQHHETDDASSEEMILKQSTYYRKYVKENL